MKKVFFILVAIIGFVIGANAQDIIMKKNGSEIKAKVLEITDQQIKYKEFDFQSGPVRNINIAEVFMIIYENGQREVFNKANETKSFSSKQQRITDCTKKLAFGMDIGLGGSLVGTNGLIVNQTFLATDLGLRVTQHFNPYFGVDFLKINWITDVLVSGVYYNFYYYTPWTMRLQFMPGVRGNTPTFFKCMSGYAAFRIGYGMDFMEENFEGLCLETEIGMNFTPTVFVGFSYNYHGYFDYGGYGFGVNKFSFRIGFNF